MGLWNSIKKFKFPLKKMKMKKRSRDLNEEEESCDSLFHLQTIEDILDGGELCSDSSSLREIDEDRKSRESDEESEDILDFGELCSDSSSLREIDEDGKSRESDEESEDILDFGELSPLHEITEDDGKSKENDEEDVLDLGDLSPLHEISTEEKNNAMHVKKREIISIEEEEEDVLDLDEISHSSSLHEINEDEEEKKSRELNEHGSSSKGRAQKCLLCPVQVKKEEIVRNINEEKNKALHVKRREIVSIEEEEDILDGEICDSSSHHEKITQDEEKDKSRQLNEEGIAAAGNNALHVKKREIISIDEEEVDHEARKEEKIREMIASEKQEKERAILELDRALAYAKRKLKKMAEKPRKGECVSYEGTRPSCVVLPQNTRIFQEEKPKKSKKRVTFIVEEKEKDEGIRISNDVEKIERLASPWVEKPRRGECVSYKGAGPSCVFRAQDNSTLVQEEKPKIFEKRVKFTVDEKGKAEAIHISSNEEKKIERFAGQEEPKMRRICNEEDEKLEVFVSNKKPTKKGHHIHNGVCNEEEEKIKEGLDDIIRPQKGSVSNEEENKKKKTSEDLAKKNPKKRGAFDEGRKVQGFDERQAKKGPVSDCSFQWKELMEMKGNFDDNDDGNVAEFNGGEQYWGNSCGSHYNNNNSNNKPRDEENVHHNKNLQFRYLFSFGIGLVMFLRVYYGISRYLLEIR